VILSDSHTKVKGGNKVIFSATNVTVAKLTKEEKKNTGDLDVWSKERAQTLARANSRISSRMLTSAFANFRDTSLFSNRSLGLWFYNNRLGCYTFLPFFYGWGSPYGSSYSTSIYTPYTYPVGTYPNSSSGNYPQGNGSNSGGGVRPAPQPAPSAGGSFGNAGGNGSFGRERVMNPETGNPMPRKNLERMPNQ
jgi:hypothetical protein